MVTFLGALLGFITSAFPSLLKLIQGKQDNAQELAIMQLQIEMQKTGLANSLQEIQIQAETLSIQAAHSTTPLTHIAWVDALNGSVRPIIAYAFFATYIMIEIAIVKASMSDQSFIHLLWTDTDEAIFAGIISYYYGSRSFGKSS